MATNKASQENKTGNAEANVREEEKEPTIVEDDKEQSSSNSEQPQQDTQEQNEETYNVPASQLNDVLNRVQALEQENQELRQSYNELQQTASQDQVSRIEKMRKEGKLVKSVKIRYVSDENGDLQPVLGWKVIKDNVWMESDQLKENQVVAVYIKGQEEPVEMNLRDFSRQTQYEDYEVIGQEQDADGQEFYNVRSEETGEEFKIDAKYVN